MNGELYPGEFESMEHNGRMDACMSREETKMKAFDVFHFVDDNAGLSIFEAIEKAYNMGVSKQDPKTGQYEKHIDHTDCIWYGNDSGCPVTCSQYRDGWNDAMDYIFKNGKGYQPYRHDG